MDIIEKSGHKIKDKIPVNAIKSNKKIWLLAISVPLILNIIIKQKKKNIVNPKNILNILILVGWFIQFI